MKKLQNLDIQLKATITAAILLTAVFTAMVLINGFRPF